MDNCKPEELKEEIEKAVLEDRDKRALESPCYSCQFFRKMDFIEPCYWVFRTPNQPNFAGRETLHSWCVIEVLDRYPAPLYEGKECAHWKSRVEPLMLSMEDIRLFHPWNNTKGAWDIMGDADVRRIIEEWKEIGVCGELAEKLLEIVYNNQGWCAE